jgi:hypothetical protein
MTTLEYGISCSSANLLVSSSRESGVISTPGDPVMDTCAFGVDPLTDGVNPTNSIVALG